MDIYDQSNINYNYAFQCNHDYCIFIKNDLIQDWKFIIILN